MKNLLTFIFFITALVLFVQLIQAKTADEIISKYIEARGGLEKLNAIKSIYMQGYKDIMGSTISMTVFKQQDAFSRTDFMINDKKGFLLISAKEGWSFIPGIHDQAEKISDQRLILMQTELDITGPLVDYTSKGNKVELVGKEEVNGIATYKIKATLPSGYTINYFIDRKTYLIIQTRQYSIPEITEANIKNREIVFNMGNYRSVDGILFPYTISNSGDQEMSGEINYSIIQINIPVQENLYTI